jgi:ubiquinone/menaquinone biosynthesis C-methylase UbiE
MSKPPSALRGCHGHVCPAEQAGWLHSPLRRLISNPARLLGGLVTPGDTAADLGCGPGYYTLPLAELVGATGQVIAVDIQPGMLERLHVRAEAAGLSSRIEPRLATPSGLGVRGPVDFALAFWMLHEVPDQRAFLGEVHEMLSPKGRLLLVEPWGHVSRSQFAAALDLAREAGLDLVSRPRVGFSRAALLERV